MTSTYLKDCNGVVLRAFVSRDPSEQYIGPLHKQVSNSRCLRTMAQHYSNSPGLLKLCAMISKSWLRFARIACPSIRTSYEQWRSSATLQEYGECEMTCLISF